MKTITSIIALLLFSLILWYSNATGQVMPELDQAQSFTLYAHSGDAIGRTATQVRQVLGSPTQEKQEHFGDVGFGLLITLNYGESELQFYEDFGFRYHYVEIKNQTIFARVNGVDIRVGDLADELAEHFPKSWAAKTNDPINTTSKLLIIEASEIEIIYIVINPAGVIETMGYSMRLT